MREKRWKRLSLNREIQAGKVYAFTLSWAGPDTQIFGATTRQGEFVPLQRAISFDRMATMTGLSAERISAVVGAHQLDEKEGDAATAFALDMINMILERHLSREETACALELLAHLRKDLCP